MKKKATHTDTVSTQEFPLGKENYKLLLIGFAIIIFGFILMIGGGVDDPNQFYPDGDPSKTPEIFSFRRITLAPVIVLFGFIFEIFAIMKKPKDDKETEKAGA
ncbi:MAG: DUF3098 domain-containing protein [Bacteroidetes bacterium]|jgi:hypothetical protein|nr:DUF3098 domain-containing protein [Bacteroidota bacterium]